MKDADKRWFVLGDPKSIYVQEDENKALYRILPFDSLLQMLNDKTITLVQPSLWEDSYENFLLKEHILRNGEMIPIYMLDKMFYGQCWTSKASSDALWRIYSPDKKSVRIRTRIKKIMSLSPPNDEGIMFLGKVEYYKQSKIEDDLRSLGTLTMDQLTQILLQSLFVKRTSFQHESEYRIVLMQDFKSDHDGPIKVLGIEPLDFIETILFDPRADDSYVERCTKILSKSFGFPKSRIKKSELYSFKPLTLNVVD